MGALSEDLGTPHFKQEILVDESDSRSLKPDLLKITVLSFILKWVANYGLKKLKLELSRHIGPNCTHQKSGRMPAAAKTCSVLPSVEVNVSWNFVILSSLASSQLQLRLITPHKCTHQGFFLPAHCHPPALSGAGVRAEEMQNPVGRQVNPSGCLRPHSGLRRAHRSETQKQWLASHQ